MSEVTPTATASGFWFGQGLVLFLKTAFAGTGFVSQAGPKTQRSTCLRFLFLFWLLWFGLVWFCLVWFGSVWFVDCVLLCCVALGFSGFFFF